MTEEQQLQKMRLEILEDINDTSKDDLFKSKLIDAKYIALDTLYPFNKEITELPDRYTNWQTRCAIELYNSMGQEGYISYSENGLSYTKADGLISKSLLNELTPKADVPR
ncbi:MAG: hypothetical protein HFH45_01330 [Bacilli bacterium]|jgi:hypothetical protein|nr:hypothetical protein [Bacilli bacterium]